MTDICDMILAKCKCTFFIKEPMKTTEPGFDESPVAFSEYLQIGKFVLRLQSPII